MDPEVPVPAEPDHTDPRSVEPPGRVAAIQIKLPPFWPKDPARHLVWRCRPFYAARFF